MMPHESRVLATGRWAASGGGVTMMPAVAAAAPTAPANAAPNDAAPAAPTGSSSLRPNESSSASSSSWHVGQIVLVKARTWPGINRPGGHGKISHIHRHKETNAVVAVDVRYTVGGFDKHLDLSLVQAHEDLERHDRARQQREVFTVGSTPVAVATTSGSKTAPPMTLLGAGRRSSTTDVLGCDGKENRRGVARAGASKLANTTNKRGVTAKMSSPANNKKKPRKRVVAVKSRAPRPPAAAAFPIVDREDNNDDDDDESDQRARAKQGHAAAAAVDVDASVVTLASEEISVPREIFFIPRTLRAHDPISPYVHDKGVEDRSCYMLPQSQRVRQQAASCPWQQQVDNNNNSCSNDDDDDFGSVDKQVDAIRKNNKNTTTGSNLLESTCLRASVLGGGELSAKPQRKERGVVVQRDTTAMKQAPPPPTDSNNNHQRVNNALSGGVEDLSDKKPSSTRDANNNRNSKNNPVVAGGDTAGEEEGQDSAKSACSKRRRDMFVSTFHQLLELNDGVVSEEKLGPVVSDVLRKNSTTSRGKGTGGRADIPEYSSDEVNAYLVHLSNKNKIMRAEGLIYSTS